MGDFISSVEYPLDSPMVLLSSKGQWTDLFRRRNLTTHFHFWITLLFLDGIKHRNFTLNESKSIESKPFINVLGYRVGNGVIAPDEERLHPLQEFPPPQNIQSLRRVVGMFAYYAKWIPNFSDKIRSLVQATNFSLDETALSAFSMLKKELERATLQSIDESLPFVVECDASEVALSATLNQGGQPVPDPSMAGNFTILLSRRKPWPSLKLSESGNISLPGVTLHSRQINAQWPICSITEGEQR